MGEVSRMSDLFKNHIEWTERVAMLAELNEVPGFKNHIEWTESLWMSVQGVVVLWV